MSLKDSIKESLEVEEQAEKVLEAEQAGVKAEEDTNASETHPEADGSDELQQQLADAVKAKDEYYQKMLRTQADFENFRRRTRQEQEQLALYGGEEILKKILPILDSLERAVAAFDTQNPEQSNWQEGVQLVLKQFQTVLQNEGLKPVLALNQPFDPTLHEAMFQEQSSEVIEPMVVEEFQKGYIYKEKLLRPSMVKVVVPIE